MTNRFLGILLLLVILSVPASIAVDLLVWPGDDTMPVEYGCGIHWVGVIPVGGYCT